MVIRILLILVAASFAKTVHVDSSLVLQPVSAEVPSMQALLDPSASTAVASPVEWWVRPANQSGIISQSELWNPRAADFGTLIDARELPVRRWAVQQPGFAVKVGNEVGDYLLQETTEGPSKGNRTPTINIWASSPRVVGLQAFVEMRQVDHFGERTRGERIAQVGLGDPEDPDGRFAWFGENYPGYSSLRGGVAWSHGAYAAQALAGIEYLWILDRYGFWRGLKSERVETEVRANQITLKLVRDSLSWRDQSGDSMLLGSQVQTRGQLRWQTLCTRPDILSLAFGMDWLQARNQGDYPMEAPDSLRVFPWAGLRVPFRKFAWSGWGGANGKDWRFEDTLSYKQSMFAIQTRSNAGSRPHPFAMGDARGFWMQDVSISVQQDGEFWTWSGEILPWMQFGESQLVGIRKTTELRVGSSFAKGMLGATQETRFGKDWDEQEWQPSRLVSWVGAEWNFRTGLRVSHVWQWQSAMHWNTMGNGNPVQSSTDGRVVWNASLHQEFPKQALMLEATWIHVLVGEVVEVPGANDDRTRFLCEIKKSFGN